LPSDATRRAISSWIAALAWISLAPSLRSALQRGRLGHQVLLASMISEVGAPPLDLTVHPRQRDRKSTGLVT